MKFVSSSIISCYAADLSLLPPVHSFFGAPVVQSCSEFDLNETQYIFFSADQIDLSKGSAILACYDPIALASQVVIRQPFAPVAFSCNAAAPRWQILKRDIPEKGVSPSVQSR